MIKDFLHTSYFVIDEYQPFDNAQSLWTLPLIKPCPLPIITVTEGFMLTAATHTPAGINARRAFRFSVGLDAGYMIYNEWCACEIIDISSRGAALKTRQVFLPGDTLKLRLSFENRTVLVDARVAYQSGQKAGIAFSERDLDGIEAFLSLVDDVLVYKARIEVKEYFARYGEMKLPSRSSGIRYLNPEAVPAAPFS